MLAREHISYVILDADDSDNDDGNSSGVFSRKSFDPAELSLSLEDPMHILSGSERRQNLRRMLTVR